MGGESLDARLEPLAQFLLIVIIMMIVAAVSSYAIMKIAQRRKERAHNKLSASRRSKETGINLFGDGSGAVDAPDPSRSGGGRKSARKGSGFNFFSFLRQLADRFEAPRRRRRGKGRRRRTSSGSDNLRLDILKKPVPLADPQREPSDG